ncbi:MAG: hypothetical protein D3903_19045, partial [Candidatus Electrothrix sp. GM3_4]|nr:hypothetical protein [Candidatus Electrothrix sp. GM3_4]
MHRFGRGLLGRQPLLAHDALHVLDHHDGIIHQQTDGQHHRKHGQHVDRIACKAEHGKGAEQDHRHGNSRDNCRPDIAHEHVHDDENQDGSAVRIKDIGRTELAIERSDSVVRSNGRPAAGLAVRQAAGANALATADAIKKKLAEMSKFFPPSVKVIYPYDTTPFTKVSI